jgi:hypothetical protein
LSVCCSLEFLHFPQDSQYFLFHATSCSMHWIEISLISAMSLSSKTMGLSFLSPKAIFALSFVGRAPLSASGAEDIWLYQHFFEPFANIALQPATGNDIPACSVAHLGQHETFRPCTSRKMNFSSQPGPKIQLRLHRTPPSRTIYLPPCLLLEWGVVKYIGMWIWVLPSFLFCE